jgi:hypothetical protein
VAGKRAGSDKKLYKELNQQYEELSKSPDSQEALSTSPFGPLSLSTSRRTFISLISTLNASFPDYDFRSVAPSSFQPQHMSLLLQLLTSSRTATPLARSLACLR